MYVYQYSMAAGRHIMYIRGCTMSRDDIANIWFDSRAYIHFGVGVY